jgi:hypothetical protein
MQATVQSPQIAATRRLPPASAQIVLNSIPRKILIYTENLEVSRG